MPKTRNVDPELASARAQLAVGMRHHPGRDYSDIRRRLAEANIAAYMKKVLASAPPLTSEQRDRLAELLKPVRGGVA